MNAAVDRIVALFQGFAPPDLQRLPLFYTPDAYFKDPFNEVLGLPRISAIYAHMFEALEAPRFIITTQLVQGNECFLAWEFRFRNKRMQGGAEQVVIGSSHLKLADDGRIRWHRDYWDAAEEVYAKLPVLGALMRWLQKKGAAA